MIGTTEKALHVNHFIEASLWLCGVLQHLRPVAATQSQSFGDRITTCRVDKACRRIVIIREERI